MLNGPILCALDLGEGAHTVMAYTRALARALGVPLHGVHVGEVPTSPDPQTVSSTMERLGRELEDLCAGAPSHLRIGRTHAEILDTAEEIDAGLLVLGTRARSTLRRAVLGSTAEAVLKSATRPVLTLPSGTRWPLPRSLLVAHDLADGAGLELAARLELPEARVHVVHAVGAADEDGRPDELEAEVRRVFGSAARSVGAEVSRDSPLEAIRGAAERFAADLVVVGRSRRSVLARAFVGTTAIALIRAAAAPVLMVPESTDG